MAILQSVDLADPEADGHLAPEPAVARAASAFPVWAGMAAGARAEVLRAGAESLTAQGPRLKAVAAEELGAAPAWIDFNIDIACGMLREAAKLAPHVGDAASTSSVTATGVTQTVRRDPVGVVLGIAPWNAPVTLAVRAVAAPLACGNTVVLKASDVCPRTHRLVADALCDAGLPEGALTVVTSPKAEVEATVAALIAQPAVRRVNFTGSTRVGRHVARLAADHLKPCLLELSGNAPMLVLEDADLDRAADAAAFSAFFNQGQICMSAERLIVVDSVADDFVGRLAQRTQRLIARQEAGELDWLGRLIHAEAAKRLSQLIDDARRWGGEVLIGGQTNGSWMAPTVIDRVSSAMRLYREEVFGPIASVMRVRDADDAVAIANDSDFGLSASVFSNDRDRAMSIAAQLETGMCHINGPTVHDDPSMPFGGMKASGYGRFGGMAALNEFTELRWISDQTEAALPRLP